MVIYDNIYKRIISLIKPNKYCKFKIFVILGKGGSDYFYARLSRSSVKTMEQLKMISEKTI